MKIARVPHYFKRVRELGPRKAVQLITHRMQTSFYEQYARYLADNKKASHSWQVIAGKHKVADFSWYLDRLKNRSFSVARELYPLDQHETRDSLLSKADDVSHNCFDILGSGKQCLLSIPWHSDIRLQHQNPDADYLFDKNTFYKDLHIQPGLTDRLVKDIKVPWELSRFHELLLLGKAYELTQEMRYAQSFEDVVTSWMDENPFLLGPNWVCPMDVSIRAINWIWVFDFFKQSNDVSGIFWQRFICSLYDHMIYLEHNWEVSTWTSNHYLSDLVGYFYLTWFFSDLSGIQKKRDWCYRELITEFEKQVFDEGVDYEGSTNYHKLVTELFYHAYILCQEMHLPLQGSFLNKLKNMFSFIDWCSPSDDNQVISIGDNDSGKILYYGITPWMVNAMKTKSVGTMTYFEKFGLSVFKTKKLHVTLRHHSYEKRQPSGHFHNDVGSITVAVDGIPIIVDPGSYVYTPSTIWRNVFRSVTMHNTCYMEGYEPTKFDRSLFMLNIAERTTRDELFKVESDFYGIPFSRVVSFNAENRQIVVTDSWNESIVEQERAVWNLTLAHNITQEKGKDGSWHFLMGDKTLLRLQSDDLSFKVVDGWVSYAYGTKEKTHRLVAERDVEHRSYTFTFFLY